MPMSKNVSTNPANIYTIPPNNTKKQIGNTTYIITSNFNGDKSRDIIKSLRRLIERDSLDSQYMGKN